MGTWGRAAVSAAAILALSAMGDAIQQVSAEPMPACQDTTTCVNQPLDRIVANPCTGEPVHVTGTQHVTEQATLSSSGMLRITTYENFQATSGIGMIFGALYNVDEEVHSFDRFVPATDSLEIVLDDHHNVISTQPAQAPNFLMHSRIRVVITESGVEVKLEDIDAECRG